jgi:CubicO group peptidase (beta-lactamase class C family)
MKRTFFLGFLFFLAAEHDAQSLYFPPLSGDEWERISPDSLAWCEERIISLYDVLEDNNTKAFIVLKDGRIVLEKYFGSFQQDSIWYWASAGKSLTACLMGIAQQEGFLSIDDATSEYLGKGWTSCTPGQEGAITIRHQLSMTTGLDDIDQDPFCTDVECLHCITDAGLRWAYHNAPYTLLDGVIETATGRNLNLYFQQKIRLSTGITGLFVQVGFNNIFFSTPRSMARFGLFALNRGHWDGVAVMTDSVYVDQMIHSSQHLNLSYGFLWWLNGQASYMLPGLQFVFQGSLMPHAPDDMFSALGKNGQYINVVPSQHMVVVRMGNAPEDSDVPVALNDVIWEHLGQLACGTTSTSGTKPSIPDVMIWPNPGSGPFSIRIPGRRFDVEVFDMWGRQVYSHQSAYETHDMLTGLASGVYWVRMLTTQKEVYVQKLVITGY